MLQEHLFLFLQSVPDIFSFQEVRDRFGGRCRVSGFLQPDPQFLNRPDQAQPQFIRFLRVLSAGEGPLPPSSFHAVRPGEAPRRIGDSQRVGKDRSTITNYLRLLNLPAETQLALSSGQISMAHARALINVDDPETHLAILHDIVNRHLSVHQTEQLVKASKQPAKPSVTSKPELPATHSVAQSQLRQSLQSDVEIKRSRRGKGTLTIHFNNDEDFDRILKLLNPHV